MAKKFLGVVDFLAGLLLGGSAGTSGEVLTSQGAGASPVWAAGGAGSPSDVTFCLPGTVNLPVTGTARRYFAAARSFTLAKIGVSVAPSSTLTATVRKNGTSVGTVTVSAAAFSGAASIAFSVTTTDYLTVDVAGPQTADVVLVLE